MFNSLAVFAFIISSASAGILLEDWNGRIVNGNDTTIEEHPYQVSLQTKYGSHFCGGSIISEDIVVTAAHCLQRLKPDEINVRLGSTEYNEGGELVAVKSFKYHQGFDSVLLVNDVGVIKLATPVRQSSNIRFVNLAKKTPHTGTQATVTGWGTKCFLCGSLPTTLQEVEVDVVDQKSCASSEYMYGAKIRETMICAYGIKKDSCQGDSGGPLVAKNELIGIVSWGHGCAVHGYPGVYCNVASMRSWIEKTAKTL